LHLARAYLTASDPAFVERTWAMRRRFALSAAGDGQTHCLAMPNADNKFWG
jgi:hypothetical protein